MTLQKEVVREVIPSDALAGMQAAARGACFAHVSHKGQGFGALVDTLRAEGFSVVLGNEHRQGFLQLLASQKSREKVHSLAGNLKKPLTQ